ncbi:hypothetical protein BC827DRAFT_1270703 [Russula dissimulans]|nr:hypothetical protein BC827DRAFT_1270703 [Russula dissimulans]
MLVEIPDGKNMPLKSVPGTWKNLNALRQLYSLMFELASGAQRRTSEHRHLLLPVGSQPKPQNQSKMPINTTDELTKISAAACHYIMTLSIPSDILGLAGATSSLSYSAGLLHRRMAPDHAHLYSKTPILFLLLKTPSLSPSLVPEDAAKRREHFQQLPELA